MVLVNLPCRGKFQSHESRSVNPVRHTPDDQVILKYHAVPLLNSSRWSPADIFTSSLPKNLSPSFSPGLVFRLHQHRKARFSHMTDMINFRWRDFFFTPFSCCCLCETPHYTLSVWPRSFSPPAVSLCHGNSLTHFNHFSVSLLPSLTLIPSSLFLSLSLLLIHFLYIWRAKVCAPLAQAVGKRT